MQEVVDWQVLDPVEAVTVKTVELVNVGATATEEVEENPPGPDHVYEVTAELEVKESVGVLPAQTIPELVAVTRQIKPQFVDPAPA